MTYYQILGVKKSATQDEIKAAYKSLMKKYHPDVYQGDKIFAEQKAKQINLAYDVLSDPSARAAYDEQLNPTSTYKYTPPKYDSNYNGSQNYYDRYTSHRYTTNEYSNTYTNNYYSKMNQVHSDVSNKIINSISKLKLIQKLLLLFLIALIYLTLLLLTFTKFELLQSGEVSGPLLNEKSKETITEDQKYPSSDNNSKSNVPDINDYFSDSTLYEYYNKSGYTEIFTFEEYKELFSNLFFSRIGY